MRSGVSALLGSFSGAISDDGAREFALSVYRELFKGRTAAEAVYRSRRVLANKSDLTPLMFSLHGDGDLRLVASSFR